MSDNRFEFDGMEAFKAALRQLPEELSQEGGDIVVARGEAAGSDIRAHYQAAAVTGNLAKGVRVQLVSRTAGAEVVVKSRAPHAFIYEHGTQVRRTANGKNLGSMPPAHVFVPTMIRARREMTDDLIDLMERNGLEVTGG